MIDLIERLHNVESYLRCARPASVHADNVHEAAAEIEALRKEVANLEARGIHTCHTDCERPLCVARRENAALRKRVGDLGNATFLTCVSGDGPTPYLKVHFNSLPDAHAAHDAMLAIKRGES